VDGRNDDNFPSKNQRGEEPRERRSKSHATTRSTTLTDLRLTTLKDNSNRNQQNEKKKKVSDFVLTAQQTTEKEKQQRKSTTKSKVKMVKMGSIPFQEVRQSRQE